jgi:uncharacterized Zn finger protein
MLTLNLTERMLRSQATARSFERGEVYYRSGAVTDPTWRGQTLHANVEGSEVRPYRVTIQCHKGDITTAHCTCDYNYEGWCKHIVAVLLGVLRQPDAMEQRPTLAQFLDRLNPLQTQQLIQTLVGKHPELIDEIERQVSLITAAKSATAAVKPLRRPTIDPAPFRRQAHQIIRDGLRLLEDGYEEDPITEAMEEIIHSATVFSEAGDGNSAIAILTAITQTCVDDWDDMVDYGADSDPLVAALNEAWTEAILSAELTPSEISDLAAELADWQDQLGRDFTMSLAALSQGWDDPPLQRVLKGEISELGCWADEVPDYADDLALVRLRILDRQARYDEYLYLAEAEGQIEQYLTMLTQLGRVDEAMRIAPTAMTTMAEAFVFAQALREQGALPQALEIAQAGLVLPGYCTYAFATWTRDFAVEVDAPSVALMAATIAFKAEASFADYQKVEALAGPEWTTIKADLLAHLRTLETWIDPKARVDIFLHEGLIADAIALVSALSSYQADLVYRVMDAAIADYPDWVIENACRRAESIMDAKKSEHYGHAIEWLRKARAAYLQANRRSDWITYHTHLLQTHARKYKLVALLKQGSLG